MDSWWRMVIDGHDGGCTADSVKNKKLITY